MVFVIYFKCLSEKQTVCFEELGRVFKRYCDEAMIVESGRGGVEGLKVIQYVRLRNS